MPTHVSKGNPICLAIKKDGSPCKAHAVTGKQLCAGHLGLGIANGQWAQRGALASAESKRAKIEARKRTPADWLALKLEAKAEMIVDKAVKAAEEGDWRAGAWLFERVLGKPKELLTVDTSSEEIKNMTPEQRAELRRRALEMHPELAELVPRGDTVPAQRAEGASHE